MLVTNFLSFPSSDNLYFPSFLKDIFTGYRILGWQLFSFGTLQIFFHSLLAPMSFFEKATPNNHSLYRRNVSFFSTCFHDFKIYLFFSSLVMYVYEFFFEFNLFGVCLASSIYKLMLSMQIFFSTPVSAFLSVSNDTNLRLCDMIP